MKATMTMCVVAWAMPWLAGGCTEVRAGAAGTKEDSPCAALGPRPMGPQHPQDRAPDFELADGAGKTWSAKALRGRPLLVHFWATWCAPCVKEIPALEALARKTGERATFLAVSVDSNPGALERFFPRGTTLTVLRDPDKSVAKSFGTEKYPESFLIDGDGRVRHFFHQVRWEAPEATACLATLR